MSDYEQIDVHGTGDKRLRRRKQKPYTEEQLVKITEGIKKRDRSNHPWHKRNAVLSDNHIQRDDKQE